MAMAAAAASMACVRSGRRSHSQYALVPDTVPLACSGTTQRLFLDPRGEDEKENGYGKIISGTKPLHAGISSSTRGRSKSMVAHAWMLNCIDYMACEDGCYSIYIHAFRSYTEPILHR